VVVGDQREGQVDAGGHAGGGPDVAVLDEDGVGIHRDLGEVGLQLTAIGPVSGRATTLEQACGREQKGAGTDRRDPTGVDSEAPDLG